MTHRVRNVHQQQREGFTVVEVLVTIAIAAVFIGAITQLHIAQSKVTSALKAYNIADALAYNNLRTFAYGKAPSWFNCTYTAGNPNPDTLLNKNTPVDGLPSPVLQTVIATAPYGCGGSSTTLGYPIRVVSTVKYGPDAKEIVHATYSTY